MPPENLKKIAHLELEISTVNIIIVMKWGNEQTNRQTRNMKLFGINVQTSPDYLYKKIRKIGHLEQEISLKNQFQ